MNNPAATTTDYKVTGMTCEHCVHAVTTEFGRLPGVAGVSVDLVPGGISTMTVTSDAPLAAQAVSGDSRRCGPSRAA